MHFFRLYLTVSGLLILPLREACAQQTPMALQSAARFDGVFAPVVYQGKKVFLHYSGNITVDKPMERIHNGGNIARKNGFDGAIDSSGKVMLAFEYDEIDQDSDMHFFKLKKNGKYGLADSTGRVVAKPQFDEVDGLNAGAVAFKQGNTYGWVSLADGKVHPAQARLARSYFRNELFSLQQGDLRGLLHENGTVVAPPKYDMLYGAYPGTMIFELNGKAGMMDITGKEICKPVYETLTYSYEDTTVRAKQGGKTGILGRNGTLTVPARYTDIRRFNNGQAVAVLNGMCGVIDRNGREIVPFVYTDIRTADALGREILNYAEKVTIRDPFRAYVVEKQGKAGLLSWNGKELLPAVYDRVAVATMNDRAYVFAQKNAKAGLFSQEGKMIIPTAYDELYPADRSNAGFSYYTTDASHAAATKMVRALNGPYAGLFSLGGETIVPVRYREMRWTSNGLLELSNGDTTTVAAADGKIVRKPAKEIYYYMVAPDRIVETGSDGYRLTDLAGNVLYRFKSWDLSRYQRNINDADFFYAGLMKAGDYQNDNLFITRDGKEVRFSAYSAVRPFNDGLALAFKDNKAGYIDSTGREVVPVIWDDIRNLRDRSNDYKQVIQNGKSGLIHRSGKMLLPVEYDRISESYAPGYFIVKKGTQEGLADSTGKLVLEPVYTSIEGNSSVKCLILRKDKKQGLATLTGQVIIPAEYDELKFNYGWNAKGWPVLVKKGNMIQYLQQNGRALPVTAKEILP